MKQVIAVRKDLNMRKGKMCAQIAHASLMSILKSAKFSETVYDLKYTMSVRVTPETRSWLEEDFKKIVVSVNSEEEINELAKKAESHGIPYTIITDNGNTEFRGEKTVTCIAFGPSKEDIVDKITGDLSLL